MRYRNAFYCLMLPFFVLSGGTAYSLSFILDDKDLLGMPGLRRGISDEKLELFNGRKRLKKEETEEMLIPSPETTQHFNDTFAGNLNFQYSFADDGTGQDWAVSISINSNYISMNVIHI